MIKTMFSKGESIRGKRRMGDRVFAFCVIIGIVAMFDNANALQIFETIWLPSLGFIGSMYGMDMYEALKDESS